MPRILANKGSLKSISLTKNGLLHLTVVRRGPRTNRCELVRNVKIIGAPTRTERCVDPWGELFEQWERRTVRTTNSSFYRNRRTRRTVRTGANTVRWSRTEAMIHRFNFTDHTMGEKKLTDQKHNYQKFSKF